MDTELFHWDKGNSHVGCRDQETRCGRSVNPLTVSLPTDAYLHLLGWNHTIEGLVQERPRRQQSRASDDEHHVIFLALGEEKYTRKNNKKNPDQL